MFAKLLFGPRAVLQEKLVTLGKTASLTMGSSNGKIQDLLLLFTTSSQAPMSGTVSFNARISLPPGEESFLKKVELQGDFWDRCRKLHQIRYSTRSQ